ncbi:hypothetical protein CHELA20_52109 [Hyphomicrobiales bacterium]|nr:hypothetical protein CHELA20_52109 [Hyphomicrobiales bacterium]
MWRRGKLGGIRLRLWDGAPQRDAGADGLWLDPRASPCRGIAFLPCPACRHAMTGCRP